MEGRLTYKALGELEQLERTFEGAWNVVEA